MSPIPHSPPPSAPADRLDWFSQEVHVHDSTLKAYLRGTFPSVGDIDDVVQESYVRVWKMRAVTPIRSAKALLFTIARRIALDLVRRRQCSPIVAVKDVDQLFVYDVAPGPFDAAAGRHEAELLVDAIDSLPGRCREIFILCQVHGLAHKEVAGRLGISKNTVAVQVARGLQRCEKHVRRHLDRP